MRPIATIATAAATVVLAVASPASAYEYQTGNTIKCTLPYTGATPFMWGYGDSNLYSSYRLERYAYNIPYSTYVYLSKNIAERSTASAADSENYVDGVGAGCWPYD